jgi:2-phospho-L-lactate guanylyltransferase
MALWAIVPVKPLRRGKSRLSEVMSVDEREDLNEFLLAHTIQEISAVPDIENVLVVSRDPAALALARDMGARTVQENGSPGLNIDQFHLTKSITCLKFGNFFLAGRAFQANML